MAFLKKATLDIKSVYATDQNGKFKWLDFVKQAAENPSEDRSKFLPIDAYKFDTDHFVYILARSISGGEKWGHNGNYDYFPWEEIKKALPTYPGCGFFIEHKEDDAEKDARGIVLDAIPNEEEQYAICLCAIDREKFPEFCQQLLDGTYNQVSMSCLANECECSLCGNVAHSFDELCQHQNPNLPITYLKGKQDDKGNDVYEINRDLCFTGLSAVAVPADKDAFVFDIKAAKKKENKLQAELVKYQNIKQAAKMKEFKMACEEQFKALDTVALLNKLQNCATAITNQVVDQQNDVNIINGPLQGILRQLMELQIGLTVLDLNKLTEKKEDFVDNTVAVEGEPNTDVAKVTTNAEEEYKLGEGHILTYKDLKDQYNEEEVNFDKEIDSMLKQADVFNKGVERNIEEFTFNSLDDMLSFIKQHGKDFVNIKIMQSNKIPEKYKVTGTFLTDEEIEQLTTNFDKEIDSMLEDSTKGISKLLKNKYFKNEDELESIIKSYMVGTEVLDSDSDGIIVKVLEEDGKHIYKIYLLGNSGPSEAIKVERVEELDSREANFDKEIESYDNWLYAPFSSTASFDQIIEKTYK